MTTRREVLRLLSIGAIASSSIAFAVEKKIPRIGMLSLSAGELLEPVREGLRTLGYVEGKNIHFEERATGDQYERLAAIADEFVKLPVDVIVTGGATATRAAQRATSTIPIVMISGTDPVKLGQAASLSHPGGNVTGLMFTGATELGAKRLELAKELIPGVTRIGMLLAPSSGPAAVVRSESEKAAKELKLALQIFESRSPSEIEAAFAQASRAWIQVLIVPPSSIFNAHQKLIIDLAAKYRMPAIYGTPTWVDGGGLVSYGSDLAKARRESARYIDRILRGAKPGDLPIELAKTVELVLNRKTARTLGLKIPEVVLLRADRVIQ